MNLYIYHLFLTMILSWINPHREELPLSFAGLKSGWTAGGKMCYPKIKCGFLTHWDWFKLRHSATSPPILSFIFLEPSSQTISSKFTAHISLVSFPFTLDYFSVSLTWDLPFTSLVNTVPFECFLIALLQMIQCASYLSWIKKTS